MDSFGFDNVKAEKAKAMRRFNRVQSIAQFFRLLELCLALIFLSWVFNRLPFAVKISGDFLRQLAGIIASPLFVFVLSNGIIATLIAKSGTLSGDKNNIGRNNADTQLYEEIVKNSGDRTKSLSNDIPPEIVYQDKQIVSEVNMITRTCEPEMGSNSDSDMDMDMDMDNPRVYRRSKSEKMERKESGKKVLRRSETEKCGEREKSGEDFGENLYPEDKLSNEEFQQTIEAFIAKHLMFRKQESRAIVLQNQS